MGNAKNRNLLHRLYDYIKIKKEDFLWQVNELNMVTPIDKAPIVVAASLPPTWPAITVEAMPIRGTVMFEIMFGIAMRSISLFILIKCLRHKVNIFRGFWYYFCKSL